jgi:UDP-N-acetyl-alpha-D-muramoyl-L-alanyl-L-glutamate epimerase
MLPDVRETGKAPEGFIFHGWETDDPRGIVRFTYAYDNGLEFCETLDFKTPLPAPGQPLRAGFEAALDALSLAAGISYYKAFLPRRLTVAAANLSPGQREFFQALYVDGLGEFAYRNRVDVTERVDFAHAGAAGDRDLREPSPAALPRRSAILLGGGKDSLVSVEILKQAGEPAALFAVNPRKPMFDCAAASGLPLLSVERHLDEKLFTLGDGALNGHVPITAIVSLIAAAAAFVFGYDTIILSSERSANEGNVVHDGRAVNHQFSKTAGFEEELQSFIASSISTQLQYFSLLRPLSELHIAHLFARTARYDAGFTSCNRAFRIRERDGTVRWCRDCPKCRFSFLILATAMAPDRIEAIFGGNVLDDERQLAGYRELVGLTGHKPWECVGEIAESRAALLWLAAQPEWRDTTIVKTLAPEVRAVSADPDADRAALFIPSPHHHMPVRFERMLNAYLGGR